MGVGAASRHYGMDWLRIAAFLLLIGYHVGLAFSPWAYEWKSDRTEVWVAQPLLALNAWRLGLLFAISGYASAALFAKHQARIGAFTRDRLARLGIPLIAAMALFNIPQPWVYLATQRGYEASLSYFAVHDYFSFSAVMGDTHVPTWMHLWFVVYLLLYTLVAAALLAMIPAAVRARARTGVVWLLSNWRLLPVGILFIWLARQLPGGWEEEHDMVSDLAAHVAYSGLFLFGWTLRGSEAIRASIARQWPIAAALGLVGMTLVVGVEHRWPGDTVAPPEAWTVFRAARAVQCWGTIVALFGVADRFFNRDHPWRATLAEAVFPFYIIHQTIILVAGYAIMDFGWSMSAQWLAVMSATIAGCVAFYFVGREIGPLRPLIGLRAKKQAPRSPIVRETAA